MNNSMMYRTGWLVLVLLFVGTISVTAQQKKRTQESAQVDVKSAEEIAERKAKLMEFVSEHHPDLKRLLGLLEERRPAQYRKAMRTLSTQFDRLQNVKKRDPKKFEIALEYWKVHSRIEVLTARIALNGPDKYEDKLKELIRQRQEIKVELQKYEVAKLEQRLNRLQANLSKTQNSMDSEVEKQLKQILNGAQRARDRRRTGNPSSKVDAKDEKIKD